MYASAFLDATEDWLSIFNRTKLLNFECQWRLASISAISADQFDCML